MRHLRTGSSSRVTRHEQSTPRRHRVRRVGENKARRDCLSDPRRLARPDVQLGGPRQSGKTTLARPTFCRSLLLAQQPVLGTPLAGVVREARRRRAHAGDAQHV